MDDRPRGEWLRTVLARFERPLVRYALALTGDLERARDIVQDTFETLWTRQQPADEHLPRWLFTVCRNRAVDVRRHESRTSATDAGEIDRHASDRPGPAAEAERRAAASAILSALDRLPAAQREVVRLRFQNGLSYKEIALVTGHSVSHVGVLIHNAVKAIRKELAR